MAHKEYTDEFFIQAFDRDQWCPVLEALFRVNEIESLRSLLGEHANDDPELGHHYVLDEHDLAAVVAQFNVAFDPGQLPSKNLDIFLFRRSTRAGAPYLVHTGYELPLLIDGRKKLARMSHTYPPMTFEGEDRFDHWVAQGLLHKDEVIEPFDYPSNKWDGHRFVYYTLKGEEWRIPAMKLIWGGFGKTSGWNETLERLEGILFGYEDWQNDWWRERLAALGGGFRGLSLCCAVTSAGLAWMESAGFRALPPIDDPTLRLAKFDPDGEQDMRAFMSEKPSGIALVRFNVAGHHLSTLSISGGGPWEVPNARIPELNRHLSGPVIMAARRNEPVSVPRRS